MSWNDLKDICREQQAKNLFTAFSVCMVSRTQTIWSYAGGSMDETLVSKPTLPETLFDLASLTKVISTLSLILESIERKKIKFNSNLESFFDVPEHGLDLKLETLLRHQSGFKSFWDLKSRLGDDFKTLEEKKEKVIEHIVLEPRDYSPNEKTVYSDMGFILLGFLIEKIEQNPLETIFETHCQNHQLDELLYLPLKKVKKSDVPATAIREEKKIQGEVHDPRAQYLGGLGGHAGVFGSARGVARVGQRWLETLKGLRGDKDLFKACLVQKPAQDGSSRYVGWDKVDGAESSGGKSISPLAFGHLGYTGTSLWVDPEREVVVALLTNRTYPDDKNLEEMKKFRKEFHNLVWEVIDR